MIAAFGRTAASLSSLLGNDRANLVAIPGELPADQRNRDDPGGVGLLEPALQGEGIAELMSPLAHQILELNLAGDVARAVARLAQVELLLEAKKVEVGAHPAAWGPFDLEGLGLREVEFVGLQVERGEPAGGALGEHDPDDFSRPRLIVEEAGVEQDRKSTRLNSSHLVISYAVFCLKKKKQATMPTSPPDGRTTLQVARPHAGRRDRW